MLPGIAVHVADGLSHGLQGTGMRMESLHGNVAVFHKRPIPMKSSGKLHAPVGQLRITKKRCNGMHTHMKVVLLALKSLRELHPVSTQILSETASR